MFKQTKITTKNSQKKPQKRKSFLSYCITFLWVIIIGTLAVGVTHQFSQLKIDINTLAKFAGFDGELTSLWENANIASSLDGKTNIVVIGRGGIENDAPDLTDSILVASLNHEKEFISLFSVPRDLYVEYPTGWGWKINEVYSRGLRASGWDQAKAMDALKEVLQKITWEEIHYFANVDFEWFRKVIDLVWGIEIDVPDNIIDHSYPGPNHTYQTFRIQKWFQILDGTTALKYARSRYSTSDFDRSLRQQLIIKSLKDKFLDIGFVSSPSKIKSVYNTLNEHVITDLEIGQIIQLALYIKDLPRENIVSSNLNDSCFYGSSVCEKWGFLYAPVRADFWGAAVLLQNGASKNNPSNYNSLLMYTNLVFNHPEVFLENQQIHIFNGTKVPWLAWDIASKLKKYGFNIPSQNSIWNTGDDIYEKSVILYGSWAYSQTVEALESFIFWWSQETILPKYSKDLENKIEIIIGNDYKTLNF